MNFKQFFEVEIQRDFEDGMHTWSTPDGFGQLDFSINSDTLHVDFLRNQDEFDAKPGPKKNTLALIRSLRQMISQNPNIKKITANVQNPAVGKWLKRYYNARQISVGLGLSKNKLTGVYEIPIENI